MLHPKNSCDKLLFAQIFRRALTQTGRRLSGRMTRQISVGLPGGWSVFSRWVERGPASGQPGLGLGRVGRHCPLALLDSTSNAKRGVGAQLLDEFDHFCLARLSLAPASSTDNTMRV